MRSRLGPIFDAMSPGASEIARLFGIVLLISAVIFLIVTVAVAINVSRYRGQEGDPEPRQVSGHKRLELVWTIGPALIVLLLLILSGRAMGKMEPSATGKPDLEIIAHQWWWEARYTATGARAANEIHIPAGKPWLVELTSADVIHDFWAPQLGRKMDVIPGHPNRIILEANQPGRYAGACAEFCGAQHAWMRFSVVAEAPADFEAWQRRQLEPAEETPAAAAGRKVFQEMLCVNCHAVRGIGTNANAGPDLTHVAGRETLGGGVILNSATNLERWMADPQEIKPACLMPDFHLTEEQLRALTSFLEATP